MTDRRETRSPPGGGPTITAAASRRIVIRAPYRRDMRARMSRCGGTPRWDPDHGVWTMPRATLSAVVDELVAAFGSTLVRLEVPGAGGQPPARAEQLLRGAVSEALPRVAVQDVPARRVPSVDRAGYVWLSYELTADVPVNAGSPA